MAAYLVASKLQLICAMIPSGELSLKSVVQTDLSYFPFGYCLHAKKRRRKKDQTNLNCVCVMM